MITKYHVSLFYVSRNVVVFLETFFNLLRVVAMIDLTKAIARPCLCLRVISEFRLPKNILLSRAAIFKTPQNIADMTVCPAHRSSLGITCAVPNALSRHDKINKIPATVVNLNLVEN